MATKLLQVKAGESTEQYKARIAGLRGGSGAITGGGTGDKGGAGGRGGASLIVQNKWFA